MWDCSGRGPAGTKPITLSGHQDFLSVVRFQHRGKLLASGGTDGLVYVWQLRGRISSLAVHKAALAEGVTSLVWSPNDQHIAVGDEAGGGERLFDNLKFNIQTSQLPEFLLWLFNQAKCLGNGYRNISQSGKTA